MRGVRALTEAQSEEIQNRYLAGDEVLCLAHEYSVSREIIRHAVMQRELHQSKWIGPWCLAWDRERIAAARRLGYGI